MEKPLSTSLPAPDLSAIRFRGMRPREAAIFRLWLQEHWQEYGRFEYNVRVGSGVAPDASLPDNIRRMAVLNSQKRIDAVAWNGQQPTIIEVKDFAIKLAIGQILEYAAVWKRAGAGGPAPLLLIVCSNYEPGFLESARDAGVQVNVLAPH